MLKKFKNIAILIVFCLIVTTITPTTRVEAAVSSEKSLTTVLDNDNRYFSCEFKVKKGTRLKVAVKILNVSGKPDEKKFYWGTYSSNIAKGSLFYDYNEVKFLKFKKGKTLVSKEFEEDDSFYYSLENGGVTFGLPNGIKRMKIKITISAVDGTKSVKSFKKSNKNY